MFLYAAPPSFRAGGLGVPRIRGSCETLLYDHDGVGLGDGTPLAGEHRLHLSQNRAELHAWRRLEAQRRTRWELLAWAGCSPSGC
jgi:allophanate hydrolase subunit 2